jgi:hypothetical protein
LPEICNIKNDWKLPSPFSRNTLISSSENTSSSFKTSFWKKTCPIISKTVMKNFSPERLRCQSELHGFRISKDEVPKP